MDRGAWLATVQGATKSLTRLSMQTSYDKSRQHIKKQRYHFADKGLCSQRYGFFQWSCAGVRAGP